MNEEMIRKYIENQREEEGNFKVWDIETEKKSVEKSRSDIKWTLGGLIRKIRYGLKPEKAAFMP